MAMAGRGPFVTAGPVALTLALFFLSIFAALVASSGSLPAILGGGFGDPGEDILGIDNLAPWATGLLKSSPPAAPAPSALAPDAKFPLLLAERRTRRPDMLNKFRIYQGGWDITNKHYWASVGYTGVTGFVLAAIWFFSFAIAIGARYCCNWGISVSEKYSSSMKRICLILLLVFTCAAL